MKKLMKISKATELLKVLPLSKMDQLVYKMAVIKKTKTLLMMKMKKQRPLKKKKMTISITVTKMLPQVKAI